MISYRSPTQGVSSKQTLTQDAAHLAVLSFCGRIELKERANGGGPILEMWLIDHRGKHVFFKSYVFATVLYEIFT